MFLTSCSCGGGGSPCCLSCCLEAVGDALLRLLDVVSMVLSCQQTGALFGLALVDARAGVLAVVDAAVGFV